MPICLRLLLQAADFAETLPRFKEDKRSAARVAMIAMTTSSSIRVNARLRDKQPGDWRRGKLVVAARMPVDPGA
jgi:hypothetical protein